MGLFKSKEEKEMERKQAVKNSMRELEKRIRKLKETEKVYIDAAQEAQREDLPEQVKLAREALKMTVSERKRTLKMLLNARIIAQMRDMSAMTGEFLSAISTISKSIAGTTTTDVSKLSTELKKAMGTVSQQTENLSEMLEDSQEDVSDFSSGTSLVSEEDIDKLIYSNGAADEGLSIDDELASLKQQLDK